MDQMESMFQGPSMDHLVALAERRMLRDIGTLGELVDKSILPTGLRTQLDQAKNGGVGELLGTCFNQQNNDMNNYWVESALLEVYSEGNYKKLYALATSFIDILKKKKDASEENPEIEARISDFEELQKVAYVLSQYPGATGSGYTMKGGMANNTY